MLVTPALVALNVTVFLIILVGPGALADPQTLVGWGGNFGPRTTNGEWWRLVTATFVHSEMLPILVRNLEGTRHRAWVRVTTPIGINALPARSEVDLEPGGSAIVETRILRGSAQREASHGIIVLAGIVDGPLERTVGTLGTVWIEPDRALMPRLRRPALIVALLLLLAAVALEFRRRRH